MRFALLLLPALMLPLSACGKKPNFVDPPVSAADVPDEDKIDLPADPTNGAGTTATTPAKHTKRQPGDNYPHLYPKPWL